jgi:hypothetical protein
MICKLCLFVSADERDVFFAIRLWLPVILNDGSLTTFVVKGIQSPVRSGLEIPARLSNPLLLQVLSMNLNCSLNRINQP